MSVSISYLKQAVFCAALLLSIVSCKGEKENNLEEARPASADTTATTVQATLKTPQSVEEIKLLYAKIQKDVSGGTLESTTLKYSCNGEKSGTVRCYTDNGKVSMISHSYNEHDHYNAIDNFYVFQDQLFFAHLTATSWSFDDAGNGATKDNVTETRFYFVDGKPERCLEKKYVIRSASKEQIKPENLPNRDTDCSKAASASDSYRMLLKNMGKTKADCLEQ